MVVPSIDLLFESALLLGAISFCLGMYVLAKDISNKLNLSYFALTIDVSLWALSFFIYEVLNLRLFESVHLVTTLLIAPLSMLFMQVLLRPEDPFFRWLTLLTFVVSVVFIPLVTFGLDVYPWIHDISYFSPILIVLAVLYMYASEALGVVKPRGSSIYTISRKDLVKALRFRNMWLYLGGAAVTLTCVMDRVPMMGRVVPALGNLLLAAYIYGLKDIVLQREYVTFRRLLGRAIADLGTAIVLSFIFVVITVWVTNNPLLYTLNVFLAAYLALFSISPIRSLISFFFQKFFFKEASRIEELTQKYSQELSVAFDVSTIGQVIDDFLIDALGNKIHSFYALDGAGKKFEKVYDGSSEAKLPKQLSVAYPLLLHWQKVGEWKPILVSEMRAESSRATMTANSIAIHLTLESLLKLESTLAIPLMLDHAVTGFVTLHAEAPPDIWGTSWGILSLFKPFFLRAGEALHDLDAYESLRERERLAVLGEMSAGLAHEIRNPLGAIKGAAQLLESHSNSNDNGSDLFVKVIIEEVNRLNKVVTQFLNYAKPFAGELRYVDLNSLAEDVIRRFIWKLKNNNLPPVKVHLEKLPEPTELAFCQEEPVAQILMNLMENAHAALLSTDKKAEEWSISVNLAWNADGNSSIFSIEVEDNGPGIKKENLEKVFIPFFTSSKNGTGLGLPICQRIAEAHGGRIELFSREEEGTRAIFRFPSRRQNINLEVL